jgi:hypothetical protein
MKSDPHQESRIKDQKSKGKKDGAGCGAVRAAATAHY